MVPRPGASWVGNLEDFRSSVNSSYVTRYADHHTNINMETPQKAKSVKARKTEKLDENDNPAFRQLDEEYDEKVAVGIDLDK